MNAIPLRISSYFFDHYLRLKRIWDNFFDFKAHLWVEILVFLITEKLLQVLIHKKNVYSDTRSLVLIIDLFGLAAGRCSVIDASNGLVSGFAERIGLLLFFFICQFSYSCNENALGEGTQNGFKTLFLAVHLKKLFENEFCRRNNVNTDHDCYCQRQNCEHSQVAVR